MEKLKKYGLPIYFVITGISLILIIVYLVVNFGFEKPTTSGYEYFNGIKLESDNLEASEAIPIIELNIARSETNPELNLTEMIITEYTDYNHNSYKRYCVQLLGNVNYASIEGNSYNTFSDLHSVLFGGTTIPNGLSAQLARHLYQVYFYEIDVDGDIVNHDYNYIHNEVRINGLDVIAGDVNFQIYIGGADATYNYQNLTYDYANYWNWYAEAFNITTFQTKTNEFNITDLFGYLAKCFDTGETDIVKSFDNLNLDKYLTITKENGSGQFYTLKDVTNNNAYFRVKCTYTDITSNLNVRDHSIIGSIAGDANYNSGVVNTFTPYYSTGVELTLMGNEFLPAKYDNITGVILTLSTDFRNYLLNLNNLILNVNINLDNIACDGDVVGIDLSSFGDLKVTNLNITSGTAKNFYIIGGSKHITSATYSSNLTLLNGNGGAYE